MNYDSFDDFVDSLLAADLSASEVLDAVDQRVSNAFPLLTSIEHDARP